MGKLIFLPISVSSGMLAGLIGKKIFALIWGQIDDQQAPQSEHRDVRLAKLALALAIEGALFSLVEGLVDHGSRHAFARLTGAWPGEESAGGDWFDGTLDEPLDGPLALAEGGARAQPVRAPCRYRLSDPVAGRCRSRRAEFAGS